MSDELVRRLRKGDPFGGVMQRAADRISALEAALAKAEKALQPFARHVDKRTCKITMVWIDGDYKSIYTGTLTPQHFFAAHEAILAAREATT